MISSEYFCFQYKTVDDKKEDDYHNIYSLYGFEDNMHNVGYDTITHISFEHEPIEKINYLLKNYDFPNLTFLNLNFNNLTKIPNLSMLPNLKILDLSFNEIEIIPEEICELKNLEKLILTVNNIKTIPKYFCKLENLTEFYCDANEFEEFPIVLYDMKNLKILDFRDNLKVLSEENIANMNFLDELKIC